MLKSIKNRTKNQANFGNDFRRDFERFCDKMGSNRGDIGVAWARPGGMREAAGGLNSLTESDKS